MRIALVGDWFLPRLGGIELQMRDLAVTLRQRGHDVEVITPVPGPDCVDGIRVHRLGVPRLPSAGIVFTAGAFARIRELLERGHYDVAHVHFGIIAPAAYGAAQLAQSLGIPTVATFHSVLRHFEVPLAALRRLVGVDDWNVQWSAVSSVVAESIRPLVGDADVTLLPNAVDARWWAEGRRSPGNDDQPLRIVSVLRLHPRKRPRALVRAFAEAAREAGGVQAELRIIGDGAERARLERLIARERLSDAVSVTGWLPREQVRRELHAADVFVMPSRLEAFGIAALEARAAGLPVVAMAQGGARDFLTHGRDALLATDSRDLARQLRRFLQEPDLRQVLASGAAGPIDGMDLASAAARHESLYRAVSGGARPLR